MNNDPINTDDTYCEYCGSPYELVETLVPYALGYTTMRESICSNNDCLAEDARSCQECGDYQWQWQSSFFEPDKNRRNRNTQDTCPSCLQFYEDRSQILDKRMQDERFCFD